MLVEGAASESAAAAAAAGTDGASSVATAARNTRPQSCQSLCLCLVYINLVKIGSCREAA